MPTRLMCIPMAYILPSPSKIFPDFGDASPKTLIGQALLHQTIVNYTKFFSNKIIKVSLFDITI